MLHEKITKEYINKQIDDIYHSIEQFVDNKNLSEEHKIVHLSFFCLKLFSISADISEFIVKTSFVIAPFTNAYLALFENIITANKANTNIQNIMKKEIEESMGESK